MLHLMLALLIFVKPRTAYVMRISDWSADVCSADLARGAAAVGSAGLLSAPTISPLAAQAAPEQAAAVQKTTFSIENMTCAMCPVTVTKAMKGVAGVKSVTVDFAAKTATVI